MGQPNEELAALIRQSGCSWAGLARRVNNLGAGQGLALRYDYTAVHRWVRRGERPRPPVPSLLAQVLSERLGRPVRAAEFGMSDERSLASRTLDYPLDARDTVGLVVDLGRADVKRRSIVAAPFVLAALATPSRDWLVATLESMADEHGPRKIDLQQVSGVRQMFALFQEMDVMRGGGHARVALVEYLNSYVMPLLAVDHDEHVQLALYEAAAEQAYLVGWMAYDDGMMGLAERWLIQSLRLAQASGNATLGAHVLAGMSDQANLLGHPREAVALARAGQRGITIDDSPACLADLQVLEARALAASGEHRAAVQAVVRAEETFDQVRPEDEPEWARFIDEAYLFGEAAHCFRDLDDPDQIDRFAGASAAEANRQGRARRAALSNAALAISHLNRGDIDAAATTASHVVDLTATVNSSRCLETVRDLAHRLAPYPDQPAVQAFTHHAHDRLGLASPVA